MNQQFRDAPAIQPSVAQNSPVPREQEYQVDVRNQLTSLQSVVAELRTNVLGLQTQLRITQRTAGIERLLNRFTGLHLFVRHDMNIRAEWESYFVPDARANYPFGQHHGREGMASWAFDSLWGEFKLRSLLTGNFSINVAHGGTLAVVTALCVTGWGKEDEINEHIAVNGFYKYKMVSDDTIDTVIGEDDLSDIVEKVKTIFKRRKEAKAEAPKADTAAPAVADAPTETVAPAAVEAVETAVKEEAAKVTAA
ncbi:hypothetical protein DV737_g1218, partial [Chaetothyriales sp. CBS 132003]